jgi:hypothetical protein
MLKREGNKRLGNDMAQKGRSWVRIQQKIIKTMLPVIVTSHLVIELQTLTVLEACLKETRNDMAQSGRSWVRIPRDRQKMQQVVATSRQLIY